MLYYVPKMSNCLCTCEALHLGIAVSNFSMDMTDQLHTQSRTSFAIKHHHNRTAKLFNFLKMFITKTVFIIIHKKLYKYIKWIYGDRTYVNEIREIKINRNIDI